MCLTLKKRVDIQDEQCDNPDRQSTKKKYKKRMKKMKNDYNAGLIEYDDIKKVLPGFNGHLKRGHTYRLRNAVLKDFILIKSEGTK